MGGSRGGADTPAKRREVQRRSALRRPLLGVVGQFNDLICAGLAEADTGSSTRTVGLPEHHPPLVALGAIIPRSPRSDARVHPAGIGQIVDNWCESTLKLGMHAPHH